MLPLQSIKGKYGANHHDRHTLCGAATILGLDGDCGMTRREKGNEKFGNNRNALLSPALSPIPMRRGRNRRA